MIDLNNVSNSEIEHLIDEWVHSKRDRMILKMRLIDGKTYQQISDDLYKEGIILSVRQLKNVIYKAQRQLFKHL